MKSQTRPQSAKQRLISDKINTLAKYHLQEINEFQEENYTLRDNINQLHASNNQAMIEAEAKEIIKLKNNHTQEK